MIDFTSLYKKVDELVDANDFEPALTLVRDAAHRILEGGKLPISKEEIEYFLRKAYGAIDRAENSQRGAFWSHELDILSEDIFLTGLKIIRKYDVQDVGTKISYVRCVCTIEKDPEKLKALREERHALEIKANALQKRS